jgi:hypothetical protein
MTDDEKIARARQLRGEIARKAREHQEAWVPLRCSTQGLPSEGTEQPSAVRKAGIQHTGSGSKDCANIT